MGWLPAELGQRALHQHQDLDIAAAAPAWLEVGSDRELLALGKLAVNGRSPRLAVSEAGAHDEGTLCRGGPFRWECTESLAGSPDVESSATSEDRGRQEAFARYVLPEVEVLVRVAKSITHRVVDAEDLVQDTLLRAYQGIDGFDGRHPRAWLLTILRNTHINRTRRRRPGLLDDPQAATEAEAEHPAALVGDPEAVVVGKWFDAVVADAFEHLPERFRHVVQLVDVEGLSYKEAAAMLGVPAGTVMSRLHRARSRIRSRLAAAGLAPRGG